MSEYRRDYYQRNKERLKANQQRYYIKHRDQILARRKALPSQNTRADISLAPLTKIGRPNARWGRRWGVRRDELKKEWQHAYSRLPEVKAARLARYRERGPKPRPGWTRELRAKTLVAQGGRCAICDDQLTKACQDHDARTNR